MVESLLFKGIFTALVALLGIGISLWVLRANKSSVVNKSLFVLINLCVVYIACDFIASLLTDSFTTPLIKVSYSAGILALGAFYYFSLGFPFYKKDNKVINYLLAAIVILSSVTTLFTDLVISSTQTVDWGLMVNSGDAIFVYYGMLVSLLVWGFVNIITKYGISNKAEKVKIKFLILGMIIFAISEIIFIILLPAIDIGQYYFFGDYSLIIFAGFAAYAIVKHGLFDVRLAIVRSVTYSLVLVTLAGVYLGISMLFSSLFNLGSTNLGQTAITVATSLLLAVIFQPVKRFFDKITNKIFYKDNYNTDDFFAKLNKILGFTTDLRGLLEHTATEIGKTLKGEQAFFFINMDGGHYVTAGSSKHKVLPKSDADQLGAVPPTKNGVTVASLLEDADPIKRLMISHRIELVLPLLQDGKPLGYLCLGDHLTSSYTNRDIKVLNTISNELIIAIQNALAVQEIREFNITLQQRIANATRELRASNAQLRHLDKAKDEFLSMASHQLRTPLTSVKGYISMIMDGDAGKVTSDQKKLLTEAFGNSERMVGLINDFLSVSRIQTGRFVIEKTPLDLSLVVEQETNSLKQNATARQMDLIYEKQPDFPMLDVDEGKIRQVIMNFIDNAIYYSHPGTAINVSMQVQGKDAVFTVKDTGIGVPASERDELFTKFYRASNAKKTRPDGTGVGLFLAKKIVDDHDGKIIFESVEGKGSTFGFSLPIKPLEIAE